MALQIKLQQKLSQQLLLTPQLQQAIKLLQMGRLEYIEAIEAELMENPVLEKAPEETVEEQDSEKETEVIITADSSPDDLANGPNKEVAESPIEWADYLESFSDSRGASTPKGLFDHDNELSVENLAKDKNSLEEHLMFQVRLMDFSPQEIAIAEQIIWNLDRDGYLACELSDIAQKCDCTEEDIEHVLVRIQHLDPVGVASRTINECLYIQLENLGLGDSLAAKIVSEHLDKVARRKFNEIAKAERVSVEDVYEAVKAIQSLEPRPGRDFYTESPNYIVPDVYVYKEGDDYVIAMNEDGIPRLRVSPYYLKILKREGVEEESKKFISEKLKSATWLIKSMHQRRRTIYRVAESIVKHQRDFFEHGPAHLKPMILKDIAQDIGVHESTVSRVTSNKYMHTPHGVFELKYFFSSSVKNSAGDGISSSSIKEHIKEIIANEDKSNPISDQKIVEALKERGIRVARRTVAKYREALGIPSSSMRKKLF